MFLTWIKRLGSPRAAFIGMIALGAGAIMSYGNPQSVSAWFLAAPLCYLALTLLVAITTNPRIYRRGGLLVFHIGLLGIAVLAAVGRLTFYEAHVEMLEANVFHPEDTMNVKSGPLHSGDLSGIEFVQGRYTVEYNPGMVRGLTHSYVRVKQPDGSWQEQVVGDDRPLLVDGYRLYTSFNKGFAAVISWEPKEGAAIQGAVHMPSYPLYEHKQENTWTTPSGEQLRMWLQLETGLDETRSWILNEIPPTSTLVVFRDDERIELEPGEQVQVGDGRLTYDRLASWMGYKIFYDPTLQPLFVFSVLSVVGLFAHFRRKFAAIPLRTEPSSTLGGTPVDPAAGPVERVV